MPINIPDKLPAKKILENENVFVMGEKRALGQDIRALKIALVNLMPIKEQTEIQIMRMLSNTPLQVEVELIHMKSHESTHTSKEHLKIFYKTFRDIKNRRFDGLIITGANVEKLEFEQVDYWQELQEIMEWSKKNVTSTIHICWGAQAALFYHYGIKKYPINRKLFGIFQHKVLNRQAPLMRGFDPNFLVPHSRHTEVRAKDIKKQKNLEILSISDEAGVYIAASCDGSQIFVTGHSEYDPNTLQQEYERDLKKGLPIEIPCNYFPFDDPKNEPLLNWRSHAFLLYSNWLNYYVYQMTPYNWIDTEAKK